ncbi:MAG: sigma-54-dependent Fis family transcriptional regulator [Desulfobacterales bacterium]|nr:sigma-54-dependent Fis family transcriptional regulator [Desulfobacterales bacterium]
MKSILVASARGDIADTIRSALGAGSRVRRAERLDGALKLAQELPLDGLFLDLNLVLNRPNRLLENHGKTLFQDAFRPLWQAQPTLDIVLISPPDRLRETMQAIRAGAASYLTLPVRPEEIRLVSEELVRERHVRSELEYLRDHFWRKDSLETVRTGCAAMGKVLGQVRSVAQTKTSVLLTGETGTGKSRIARLIHLHSHRKDGPFIGVHCGAIPDTLLESELFGHEKGAFTGAVQRKPGKFEIARGGTLFLDEIGTMTPSAQIRLLTVLQEGHITRVGGEVAFPTDVRIIAATNADLAEMVATGSFRKDLFYRLNIFPIEIPPLRQRTEDLADMVETFIEHHNRLNPDKFLHGIHPEALRGLVAYSWPGNIRELENLVERACIIETGDTLTPESFPNMITEGIAAAAAVASTTPSTLADTREKGLAVIERQYLSALLTRNHGKIATSAQEAGISTRQLHNLMQRYRLRKEAFKAGS